MGELDSIRTAEDYLAAHGFAISACRYELDRGVVEHRGDVSALDCSALSAVTSGAHTLQLTIEAAEWSCLLYFAPGVPPVIDLDGDLMSSLADPLASDLRHAVERRDVNGILEVCDELPFHGVLTMVNEPISSGFHWVKSLEVLGRALTGPAWAVALTKMCGAVRTVVIGGLADETLSLVGLELRGELPVGSQARRPTPADLGTWRPPRNRELLPNPLDLAEVPQRLPLSAELSALLETIRGISSLLVWYWIANSVTTEGRGMRLTFSGSRVAVVCIDTPQQTDSAAKDQELFQWLVQGGDDPARLEAVQQAAALALPADSDTLVGLAEPTRRTASTLYSISRQGAVAEALATRRSARQVIFSASVDASKTAREVSGRVQDRTVVQIAAGVGIYIANSKQALDTSVSVLLLVVLAAVGLTSWLASIRVDIETAEGALRAVGDDLDEYRESLSEADIAALRSMRVIGQAEVVLARARVIAKGISLGVAAILVVVAAIIGFLGGARVNPTQMPASVQPVPSATLAPAASPTPAPTATTTSMQPLPSRTP
jgi:hypothetical protein